MSKYRQIKFQTLPRQIAQVQDRLDELVMGGTGASFGGPASGVGGEDLADVSPNLVRNPGFEDWTLTECDFWQSAEDNDWDAATQHYAQESTTVYSLPYSVKLGDGSNGSRGIAQESAFRVVPGESYYLSVRLLGGDADVEYAVILKALESDGVTEITTGTPLGSDWTYDAALGGWIITGVAGTDWTRITAPITLAPDDLANDVCYLRASIQYYQNGAVKYLCADDFAITRGSQLPAFSYYYLSEPSEPDVHKLLSLTHTDTLAADVVAGDIIYGNATPNWARLAKGANGQLLYLASGLPAWGLTPSSGSILYGASTTAWAVLAKGDNGEVLKLVLGFPSWEPEGGGTTHALLSATHTDSLPASVATGDLIYGNSTPAWARLPKNANGELLYLLGGLPAWGLTPSSGSLLCGASASAWGVLAKSTDGYILKLVSGFPSWQPETASTHALLSATHTDTLPSSVAAGDLIYGNSTPKWGRLPKNANGELLYMLGGLPAWGLTPSVGSLLWGVSATAWGVLAAGAPGYVLTMYGGNPTWRPTSSLPAPSSGSILYGNLSGTSWDVLPSLTVGYVLTLYGATPIPTWRPNPLFGSSGTAHYFAMWTNATQLGNGPLYVDYNLPYYPVRAITNPWRFEVMPLTLLNSSSAQPNLIPTVYMTQFYRREDGWVAYRGRFMEKTADLVERVLVSTLEGRWGCAAYWEKESDYASTSHTSSLGYSATLTRNDSDQWFYNSVELNSGGGGGSSIVKGSAGVTFSNTPGYVDVTTGLASVAGAVCTFDYDMGDGVAITVHHNYPSAGKIRIYGRNVTGTGSLGLTVFWIAW